jgi:hypothetical protein
VSKKPVNRYYGPGGWPQYARDLRQRVQLVLDRFPVSVILIVPYQSFALQVDKAKRNDLWGDDLHDYCHALIAKYLEWRLDRQVMEAILSHVFNISPELVRPLQGSGEPDSEKGELWIGGVNVFAKEKKMLV